MGRRTSTKQPKTKRKGAKRKNADDKHSLKRVDHDQLNALIDRAGQETLFEEEREELRAVVDTLAYLVSELDEKNLTLRRLRSLLGLPASEKLGKILPDEADDGDSSEETPDGSDPKQRPSEKPKETPKGHGRNGEQDYTSAERVDVPHESLKPGDACPCCPRGKVYERKTRPRILVRVEGQPPLKATVYKLPSLRCSLCGHVFAARSPDGVGDERYDAGARAMIALLK